MEEWKQINESNYEVSTMGNVRNRNTGDMLKPKVVPKKKDYVCYSITIADTTGGKQKHHKIHQLVARAFIPNPENKKEIYHIDRNTANNEVSNLRWSSRSEQCFNSRTRSDNLIGERNIHYIKGRDCFHVKGIRLPFRSFKTLEEAVIYRDSILDTK